MVIGVLADTHIPSRAGRLPEPLLQDFTRVDLIVHAGDITVLSVLDELARLAPVVAVAGNMDSLDVHKKLGETRLLELERFRIGVLHGHGGYGKVQDRALAAFPDAHCVVFGHTHAPYCQRHGDVLLFNPGSPTDRRRQPRASYGLLHLGRDIRGEIIYLDGGD
ncbi:MAG: metallophosphoesterase [Candidatus Desulforudis sp.]|nr:metallophosphoesterase [Desulforudis sp.]